MEQNSLFYNQMNEPLAARLRPQSLDEIIGQQHLIGEGKVLRRMVESDRIPSLIFWGPPGVGKTTLASVIAKTTRANFINFSAVTSGIKEIKEVMKRAEEDTKMGERTIVFVDEIHRFNKAQQDAFLPFVEKGAIILIGATTENPSFEVNGALLSRCKVFVLKQLSAEDIVVLLKRAIEDPRSFEGKKIVENHPRGKMKKLYTGEHAGDYMKTLMPTPDKITKLGIARTFQNIRLFKSQTVFENILIAEHVRRTSNLFTATLHLNGAEEKAMRDEADRLLGILGLNDVRDELATSLPYGKQRRLEIARALATKPSLLLLDEPAAGMNPQETVELTDFIGQIRDDFNLTIFMIEHHMDLVMEISERIYVLDFGRLISHGTPEVVQNDPKVISAYLGVQEDE